MLSDRQTQLLKIIINEYLDSAEPVGSSALVQKYNLKFSAATVRNEMADMIKQGFLNMMHSSSGRVPTAMAYKLFLNELMEEEELPVLQEVAVKQRLWPERFNFYKLLRQAALSLAEVSKELCVLTTDEGFVTHAGAVNVLDNKEFWDIDVARVALHLLDRHELLEEIFNKIKPAAQGKEDVFCVVGSELGQPSLENCALLASFYDIGEKQGAVAVLGPARMNYAKIIPAIRYTKNLIEDLVESW